MEGDQTLEIVGQLAAMLGLAAGEGVACQIVGVADMVDARQKCAKLLAVGDHAADRGTAEIDPVIASLAPDQPEARALAAGALIRDGDLERGFNRLRTGVGEKDMVD